MTIAKALSINDLRTKARRRLPLPIFDYLDGGADDEATLGRNQSAFGRYELIPDVLVDVSHIRTRARIFGRESPWPLLLGPTGLSRMFHNDAELGVARAATARGLPYALSTMGTTTIETFAEAVTGPKAFQIYIFKDRGLTDEFVARCTEAKYDALILTVDTLVSGNRERDRRNGLSIPPKLSWRGMAGFALRPAWSLGALSGSKFDLVNVSHRAEIPGGGASLFQYTNSQFDRTLTWRDVERLAATWKGPLLIKGVMTAADARRAADVGATGVMISNHGGRQLDGAPAPLDQISEIADAMGGGDFEIICDGGVRRGTDIIKALALGATACSIGRPYLYGLAAGGEAGVARALDILFEEFERGMVLAGVGDIRALKRSHVRRAWER